MPKILTIDNKKDDLVSISALLKKYIPTCTVITGSSASEGLKKAKQHLPDTILVDIIMPGIDGYEICQKLKSNDATKHIPVIMLTPANTDSQSRIKALELGADAFLTKPVDPAELTAQIRAMLRIKNSEDKLRIEKDRLKGLITDNSKKLRVSEEQLRNIVENSSNLFYSHTTEHVLTYLSPQVKNILGYEPEEAMRKWTELISDNPINEKGFELTVKAIETGKPQPPYNLELIHKSGKKVWGEVRETPVVMNGKTISIVGALTDITECKNAEIALKQSEIKFRLHADYTQDWEYWIDPEGNYIYLSPSCEKITGYHQKEFLANPALLFELVHPDYKKKIHKHYHDEKNKLLPAHSTLFPIIHRNGEKRWLEHNCRPIFDEQGNYAGRRGNNRDITKRKIIEEALKASEKKYRQLIETTSEGFWLISLDKKTIDVNQSLCNMLGYSREEMIGKTPFDFVDEKNRKIFKEQTSKITARQHRAYEISLKKKNGVNTPTYFKATTIFDENGKPSESFAFVSDIIERKRVEEALRESEEKQRLITENTRDLISINALDRKATIMYVSPSYYKILGYTEEELVGTSGMDFIHPEDKKKMLPLLKKYISLKVKGFFTGKKREIYEKLEYRVPQKSGGWRYTEAVATLVGNNIVFVNRDITERKQAEEELKRVHNIYRETIENSRGVPYLLKFPERRYEYTGEGFEKLLGIPANKMTSDMWKKIIKQIIILDQDAPQNLKKYGDNFLNKEVQTYRVDIKIETASGETKWINDCSLPIVDKKSGKVVASMGILQDISDRKNTEKKLEKLLKEKEILLKEVYHRVKNNFALVSSLLSLQSRYIKDKKALETLNTSRDRIQSMAMVHQQLYQSVDLENINFKKYIRSLIDTLFNSYVTDPSKFFLETKIENLPIGADLAIPCGLIINELVTNALKYAFDPAQTKKGKIIISFRQIKNGKIELVVQDNGIGLPKNFNIEEAESLGLKIVKLLVQQIDGTLEIISEKGTEFRIRLNTEPGQVIR